MCACFFFRLVRKNVRIMTQERDSRISSRRLAHSNPCAAHIRSHYAGLPSKLGNGSTGSSAKSKSELWAIKCFTTWCVWVGMFVRVQGFNTYAFDGGNVFLWPTVGFSTFGLHSTLLVYMVVYVCVWLTGVAEWEIYKICCRWDFMRRERWGFYIRFSGLGE